MKTYRNQRSGDLCWNCLLLAAFFSPLRCYGLFTIGVFTGSLFKIFSLLMIVFVIIKLFNRKYIIERDAILWILLSIIVYDIITLVYSSPHSIGLFPSYFVSHVILLFGYIVIQNSNTSIKDILKYYVCGSLIPIALGLYQWINVMRGRGVPQLPLQRFIAATGKDDLFLYGNYRVSSTLLDPSYFGLYVATVFVICFGSLLYASNFYKNKYRNIFLMIIMGFSIICIFSTGSVSSIAGVSAGLFFLLALNFSKWSKLFKYFISMVIAFIAVEIFMIHIFDYNPLQVLLDKLAIQSGRTSSVGEMYGREAFFKDALNEFLSSPIYGVGFGNMVRGSAHNSYLTILATQGIIGFFLHLSLILHPFFDKNSLYLLNNRKISDDATALCFSSFIVMLTVVMAYDCLYKMDPTVVVILLILGQSYKLNCISLNNDL